MLKLLKGDDEVLRLAKSQVQNSKESEGLDDEGVFGNNDIQSHIALALEHIKDGSSSGSGIEPPIASLSLK